MKITDKTYNHTTGLVSFKSDRPEDIPMGKNMLGLPYVNRDGNVFKCPDWYYWKEIHPLTKAV